MRNKLRRPLAFLLSAVMIVTMSGTPVHAVADRGQPETGLCEHHTAHTDDCGYQEETPETPCGHEHTEDCYVEVTECVHEHTPECYPEAEDTDNEGTPSNAKAAEPTECTHVCGEDTGCITKVLDCQHEHDDSCGYSEGTPCGYVCEICANADKPAGGNETEPKEPETPACICEELCTEDSVNESCPVCGMDGADLADCNGKQPAPDQENGLSIIAVTGFDGLDEAVQSQTVSPGTTLDKLNLPATLGASGYTVTDGTEPTPEPITIDGVTWTPDTEYDDTAEQGRYTFTAVLPAGYTCAEGVKPPEIYVRIGGQAATLAYVESEYSKTDVDVINAIIDNNGLSATKDDPASWTFATWDDSSPKRITRLSLGSKSLTGTLDVSGLSSLTTLFCNNNQLGTLDVSGLASLTTLFCDKNQLGTLDVSGLASLTVLNCSRNQLGTLDVSGLSSLTELDCSRNQLGTLDVSDLSSLAWLYCNNNQLGTLDVSGLASMTRLDCNDNQLGTLNVSGLSSLTVLNFGNNPLVTLDCSDTQLRTLDVSYLLSLTDLDCSNNQLGTLDVSKNTALTRLNCSDTQLRTLDVSGLSSLTTLSLEDNPLTSFTSKEGKSLTITPSVGGTVKMTSVDLTDGTKINLTVTPGYIVEWTGLPEGTDTSANPVTFILNNDVTAKVKKLLTADMIAAIPAQTYTGSAIEPALTVTDGSPTIIQQSDYTVSYTDNTEAGIATATITATAGGNYSGSASKTFAIVKADSVVGEPAISSDNLTYDDSFTVTFTPKLLTQKSFFARTFSRSTTPAKTAELYLGNTLLATQNNVTENTEVTFTVNADKRIPSSAFDGTAQTFTIRWGGDDNLNASEGSVTATLNKKTLTGEAVSSTSKVYDGTNSFTDVALNLTGAVSGDTVTATADGTAAGTGAGTHAFTATQTTLGGADVGYYSLAANAVSGSVIITEKDVTATGRNDSRNVVVNSGTFAEPVFDGENGEKVTGTFTYNYNGKTTYADVVTELKGLAKDAEASVDFTFTANGNYTGTITGTLTMKVVGLEFSTVGAVTPAANPVYGSDWNTLLKYDAGKLSVTLDGVPVSGTYTFTVDGAAYNGAAVPRVGSYSYRLTFTTADNTFTDVEVLSGNITVAQREAALSWSNTTLTYNGSAQKPTVTISNKVDSDDVAATVTGEQTNAGDGYTATVSGLTGTSAANYKLPAVTDTTFKIQPATPAGEVTISGDDANTNNKLDTGDTVTADISAITPAGGTAACQWKKTVGGTTTDLGTGATYTLDGDDTRGKIFCVVTFSGNVTGTKKSNKLDIAKELLRGTITISGNTAEGSVLTVSTPANTGITANDYTIAWYRDGAAIDAHGTSYTVTDKDLGKTLKVIVTAAESSEGFTGALTSNEIAIPATAPGKPVITLKPDNGKITVSWAKVSDNGSALTGYSLSVKQGGTDITGSPFAIDAGATSHTVNGLTNGTEYTFVLTAINGIGSTASDAKAEKPKTSGGSSGGGNGGGSSGSGSSGSGDSSSSGGGSTIVARPDETKPEIPTTSQTKPATPDKNGDVAVDNGTVQSAINTAKNDAKKNGNTANGVAVVIPVTPKEGQNSFNVTINAQTLNTLVRENVKRLEINIEGVVVGGMDTKLLKWLDTLSANGDVIFRVKQTDPSGLSKEAKAAIGTRPVYDLSLVYLSGGKETPITDFDGHTIAVRLPYAPSKDEQAGNLYAVYVDGKGKVEWLTKSSYDPDLGTVVFETGHFSIYGIGYKNPAPAFTDIKNHWAEDNIIFVASRGLLTGTGNNQFSPDTGMTRGMFVTALGRLAGIDPDSYKTGKFTDVKADAYYAPYVNWAAEKGIVNGTTSTTFSPDTNITREQMAVIMAGYAKKLGYDLPVAHDAVTFADNAQISSWAAKEVKAMQQAGIMAGKGGNLFDPKGTATRAEVATVLRRFVEIVIDPQTAQGWLQNHSGSWQYMKNGKPATGWLQDDKKWYWLDNNGWMFAGGWKQIDGKWYYFYSDGSMAVNTVIDGRKIGPDGAETKQN